MTRLLVCVDGSSYADKICVDAAWAAKRLDAGIDMLHVLRRRSEYQASAADHTGSIGLGARGDLMEQLTKVDEERGRLDQQKGRLILEHGVKVLNEAGIADVKTVYRRGSLSETIKELEADFEMIFVGKRGEQANLDSEFLGSNLEKVARLISKPLFVVSSFVRPMRRFLIAYDGKENAEKAVDFVCSTPLVVGMECHFIAVESPNNHIDAHEAVQKLNAAGYNPTVTREQGKQAGAVIASYAKQADIDLVLTGAYGHSKLRSLVLGSTTAVLIKSCPTPLLLFR